ncbi:MULTISPECIES: 50S ribosomal protein L25 [Paenibacillus]|uniref:Large ribosomal subunit protein bL25 n=1 Tax=Paenibacillus campinasensis TaxID=66347 RepID=A0A268F506_9BACL|nr:MULTISPECIES: 50S ribosomal protein L25 [Paenibacillus]MUG64462.1 50S ribosomal protein L25 [Paenibacillus campinasensis]PAD80456.1 50S ribosomal protein L25 [Paenibacillus campinasensis]PAK55182.1 50S ribosomal protein L25 [Paenibacillus sp. 7541]
MSSKGNNVQLKAELRTEFTRASRRRIREGGGVPAVVYGAQSESIPVAVNLKETSKLFVTGRSEVFHLDVAGKGSVPVLIKDVQKSRGDVAHIDFLRVSMNKPVRVSIPVEYKGTAAGTKTGGILQTQVTEVEVEGLPSDLPTTLEADVSALEVGDKLTVADLHIPEGVTVVASEEEVLVSVIVPRAVSAAEEVAEGEQEIAASEE